MTAIWTTRSSRPFEGGQRQHDCSAATHDDHGMQATTCDFGPGAAEGSSGGPWMINYDNATGLGVAVSNTSDGNRWVDMLQSYGVRFADDQGKKATSMGLLPLFVQVIRGLFRTHNPPAGGSSPLRPPF